MVQIITDSAADIPRAIAEELGIRVVPMLIQIGGTSYRDEVDITRQAFYARLPSLEKLPTTAAPGPGQYAEAYQQCPEETIFSIHLASAFSAALSAARLGAEGFGTRIHVFDSGTVSMGLGWQAIAAAEAAAASKPVEEIQAILESVRQRVRLFAALDTMEFLRRGGRANAVTARFADLLQIKPILELGRNRIDSIAQARTRSKVHERLIEIVEGLGRLERLAVLHTNCPADAETLAGKLARRSERPPILCEVTPVIGSHAGPNAVGVAAVLAA
jgi:DegV family protein with EDD domain